MLKTRRFLCIGAYYARYARNSEDLNKFSLISIIIPVWQEGASLQLLCDYFENEAYHSSLLEVIVVACTEDKRYELKSHRLPIRVVVSPQRGRGAQLNYGASQAQGEVYYFVHADTYPPKDFAGHIIKSLQADHNAGCFRLGFNERHWALDLCAWSLRWPTRFFRFGDQTLFVQKTLFEETTGYRSDYLVMEDHEFVSRLYKSGRFKVIPVAVKTSTRKFRKNGVLRLLLIFTLLYDMYYLGFTQQQLSNTYRLLIRQGKV